MIATTTPRDKAPAPGQPMGWPIYSHMNAANQARQQAETQRQRVAQLERRNRRLRAGLAGALTLLLSVGVALLAIGLVLGYAAGVGLIGVMGR